MCGCGRVPQQVEKRSGRPRGKRWLIGVEDDGLDGRDGWSPTSPSRAVGLGACRGKVKGGRDIDVGSGTVLVSARRCVWGGTEGSIGWDVVHVVQRRRASAGGADLIRNGEKRPCFSREFGVSFSRSASHLIRTLLVGVLAQRQVLTSGHLGKGCGSRSRDLSWPGQSDRFWGPRRSYGVYGAWASPASPLSTIGRSFGLGWSIRRLLLMRAAIASAAFRCSSSRTAP